jgi:glycosyltransferase involved in cell wall biosynthesis
MSPRTSPAAAAFAIPGDVTTRTGGFIYERRLLESLRAAGREVHHLQLPASFPDPSASDVEAAVAVMQEAAEQEPLIVDGLVFGSIPTEALARVRAPICAMIHHPLALESGLTEERSALLEAREAANLELAAHVLVPSPHTADILVRRYGARRERVTIAPPGFDRPAGAAGRKVRPPMILCVGILHPRKGQDVLLRALARIADLSWQAQIVGPAYDPAFVAALEQRQSALGLGPRVTLPGSVDDVALQELYRSATIFALPTRYEGYGMVLSEALLHGLPVVSTRTGAVPDTVPGEAGLLVPVDDPEALAAALRRLLGDAPLLARMSRAAAEAGAALPGWPETAAIAGAVLDRLAAGRGAGERA